MKKLMFFLLPIIASAHDMWIEKTHEGYQLNYGHLHSTKEHGGKKIIPYNPEKVEDIICQNNGNIETIKNPKHYPILIKHQCDELFISINNGYFTKTPYGTKNLPKNKVKMALKSWKSFESVKRIEKNFKKSIGTGLEIVLLNEPTEVGDKARLLILFDAKPIKGVVVAYGDKPRGESDADGRVNIRLKKSGLQNIKAVLRQESHDDRCDEIVYATSLNIEL
jgi:nickel transport protein